MILHLKLKDRMPAGWRHDRFLSVTGRSGAATTQVPDSVNRVLAAARLTLLSIVAALIVPASLGALRVALLGEDAAHHHVDAEQGST
jgi:hypothetical protein